MALELWRWQSDFGPSAFYATAVLSDGSLLVAGIEWDTLMGYDFVAFKLDTSGDILWRWKDGSSEYDVILGAAAGSDGSVVLSGYTWGDWSETSLGETDFAAVKLDSNGDVVWRLQSGSVDSDKFYSVAVGPDDSAVLGGYRSTDFSLIKVDADGDVEWEWTEGSDGYDLGFAVAMVGDDGSVVLAGRTSGDWSETNAGGYDFAAVKVDANGEEISRWQYGTTDDDEIRSLVASEDGSLILGGAGHVLVNSGGTVWSSNDVAVWKLGADNTWVWTVKVGTTSSDGAFAMAQGDDGSVIFAGYTYGDWSGVNQGDLDCMAGKLNASDGTLQPWRWQDGTSEDDVVWAIAPVESEGSLVLVGYTYGSFEASHTPDPVEGFIVMVTYNPSTNEPSPAPVRAVTSAPVSPPTPAPVRPPTSAPVSPPTPAPVRPLTSAPVSPPTPAPVRPPTSAPVSPPTPAPVRPLTTAPIPPPTPAPTRASTDTPTPLPTLSPTFPSLSGPSYPAPAPTSATEATGAPLPAAPLETPAPCQFVGNPFAPLPTLSPAHKPSPIPTPIVGSIPTAPTSSSPGPSGSSSSTIVIATVIPTASILALLVLVLLRSKVRVHQGPRRAQTKPNEIMEDIDTPGPVSGPAASGGGGVGEVVSGQQTSLASLEPQATPGVILDSDYVQVGHGGYRTVGSSQEPSATIASQSRSGIEPTVPPGNGDIMRGGVTGLPSPGALGEGSTRLGRKNWRGYATAAGDDQDSQAFGIGRGIYEGRSAATASKSGTSCAADARLQMYASKNEGVTPLGGGRRSCEAQSGNSEGTLRTSDATEEYPSGPTHGQVVGTGRAILEAARELVQASMIPAVSEAAAMISVLVRLMSDNNESDNGVDGKLRWCNAIVALLGRATDLLSKGKGLPDAMDHVLLEDVRESIDHLVQLIRTYGSKGKMVRVMTSSLFKRRQEELEIAIDRALRHVKMGLHLHGDHQLNAVGQDMKGVLLVQQQRSPQGVTSDKADQARAASWRQRQRRKLEQLEIPENEVTLTDELLGKGGFGSVYIADYNGRNAAAKILSMEHDLAGPGGSDFNRDVTGGMSSSGMLGPEQRQLRAFMRELDAMVRLRSPYTVNVYGAVTSRSDQLILVMELMSGGDLRTFLRDASGAIEEERARSIIGDVCAGMAFLHDKSTIHGDLKSANVLFDGYGTAKICDFGTSLWTKHMYSTGLVTYTTAWNQHSQMSLPWTAPEVLNKGEKSFKSDVYSFGMVTWEVLTRDVPWANENEILQIYRRVVFKDERPDIPEEAPSYLADIVRACWLAEPSRRPSFQSILKEMESNGWREA